MDTDADAYASCPRYEAVAPDVSPCRCPCPGCVHHCAAHQDREAEEEAGATEDGEAEDLEGCGICTQFTPCPNPGVGCYVNPPAGSRIVFDDTPIDVYAQAEALDRAEAVAACTACDDSDEPFCAIHEPERRVLDLTHGGSHACPGPDDCADFDCPCG